MPSWSLGYGFTSFPLLNFRFISHLKPPKTVASLLKKAIHILTDIFYCKASVQIPSPIIISIGKQHFAISLTVLKPENEKKNFVEDKQVMKNLHSQKGGTASKQQVIFNSLSLGLKCESKSVSTSNQGLISSNKRANCFVLILSNRKGRAKKVYERTVHEVKRFTSLWRSFELRTIRPVNIRPEKKTFKNST